MWETLV